MSILKAIVEKYSDEEILIADGFDEAIIGIEENTFRLIYSVTKCLEIIEAQGMPEEDALEHFYFKIHGSYIGEKTPIFCFDDFQANL
jgi:hypothetical protein